MFDHANVGRHVRVQVVILHGSTGRRHAASASFFLFSSSRWYFFSRTPSVFPRRTARPNVSSPHTPPKQTRRPTTPPTHSQNMFAASVDGTLFGFRFSPLGTLDGNIHCLSCTRGWFWRPTQPTLRPRHAPCPSGVRLYERERDTDEVWRPVQWPNHLWWTRFLLTGHVALLPWSVFSATPASVRGPGTRRADTSGIRRGSCDGGCVDPRRPIGPRSSATPMYALCVAS